MTEPNANDAGELNLEQLESIAGGALTLPMPTSTMPLAPISFSPLTSVTSPMTGSSTPTASSSISLVASGSGLLSVGTITMPTTTAGAPTNATIPTSTIPTSMLTSDVSIINADQLQNGTGGFTIG